MRNYLDLLQEVLDDGMVSEDRTGVGTRRLFGKSLRFNLREGFPLMTTKKVNFKVVMEELFWFISGSTNNDELVKKGCNIWTANYENQGKALGFRDGEMGRIYGYNWRRLDHYLLEEKDSVIGKIAKRLDYHECGNIEDKQVLYKQYDQLSEVVRLLKEEPESRRIVLQSWIPTSIPFATLPACHRSAQFLVNKKKKTLSCVVTQGSSDIFLGLPFNIASYALLVEILASICGYLADELIFQIGDLHLYRTHIQQAKLQLTREPNEPPFLLVDRTAVRTLESSLNPEHYLIINYKPQAFIRAPMAV